MNKKSTKLLFALIIVIVIAYFYSNRFIVIDNSRSNPYLINRWTKKCYYIAAPADKGVIEFYLREAKEEDIDSSNSR